MSFSDTDGSESLQRYILSNVPDGANIYSTINPSQTIGNKDNAGNWTLTIEEAREATIRPPLNSDSDFTLQVTAFVRDNSGQPESTTLSSLSVRVDAVADSGLFENKTISANEDVSFFLVDKAQIKLFDDDNSEVIDKLFVSLPASVSLSAGQRLSNVWTIDKDDIKNVRVIPAIHSDADFSFTVSILSKERSNNNSILSSETISVSMNSVVDDVKFNVQATSGNEDSFIDINVIASLTDSDGSETILSEHYQWSTRWMGCLCKWNCCK